MSHTQFPSQFGKYILLDRLNSGGMAEIYRAKVTGVEEFQRLIAIKCMLPSIVEDKQFVDMFIDEAKLSAQLSHANVVQIYELGSIETRLYIAMELVAGRDLRHLIQRAQQIGQPLPTPFVAYILAKAAEGLDYAHRKKSIDGQPLGLVHRDVSPQNILVSYDGEVKIVDFGIAKAKERATETQAGFLKGKFAYMAPEQVMGQPLDRRVDIFALGAVLYESLSGKKLFTGESDLSILDKVRKAQIPDFVDALPNAPSYLIDVLTQALAMRTKDRFQWASEFAEALEPLLIADNRIFGAKNARTLMHGLYADEIETLGLQLKRYASISADDCNTVESIKGETEIFESAFAHQDHPHANGTVPLQPVAMDTLDTESGVNTQGATKRSQHDASALQTQTNAPTGQALNGKSNPWVEPTEAMLIPTRKTKKHSNARTSTIKNFFRRGTLPDTQKNSKADIQNAMELLPKTQLEQPSHTASNAFSTRVRWMVGCSITVAVLLTAGIIALLFHQAEQRAKLTQHPMPAPNVKPVVTTTVTATTVAKDVVLQPTPKAQQDVPKSTVDLDKTESVKNTDVTRNTKQPTKTARPAKPKPKLKSKPRSKTGPGGYLSIQAIGVRATNIFVDGRFVGKSPIVYHKVRLGKHRIKAVEVGNASHSQTVSVTVTKENTRRMPMKSMIKF